jgi:hypothetical protein
MDYKNVITCGYPRSGTTFTSFMTLTLFPEKGYIHGFHSTKDILNNMDDTVICVPIRHPKDCIPSWFIFRQAVQTNLGITVDGDVNFFIRMYSLLATLNGKVLFLDFNRLISEENYVKNSIKDFYGLESSESPTLESVRNSMLEAQREGHLPQNYDDKTQSYVDGIKKEVLEHPLYEQCVELYEQVVKYCA